MEKLKVGDRVKILKYWVGEGVIEKLYSGNDGYEVRMESGIQKGHTGGFELDEVELIPRGMEVLSIKRSQQPGPLKIYGKILGDPDPKTGEQKTYNFAYYRGLHREWQCSCESFMLSEKGKNGNCKHLRLIRKTYGRYGSSVEPTRVKAVPSTEVPLTVSQS